MKFAHLNNEKLVGWYDSEIHTRIPTPNIKVTDEVWQKAVNMNANAYINGQFLVKDFSTEAEKTQAKIRELKLKLAETDYKVLPDYDKPNEQIKAQRQAWRDQIRKLNG
jgi:hypothetical protein